jgi:hypothetical protein
MQMVKTCLDYSINSNQAMIPTIHVFGDSLLLRYLQL